MIGSTRVRNSATIAATLSLCALWISTVPSQAQQCSNALREQLDASVWRVARIARGGASPVPRIRSSGEVCGDREAILQANNDLLAVAKLYYNACDPLTGMRVLPRMDEAARSLPEKLKAFCDRTRPMGEARRSQPSVR